IDEARDDINRARSDLDTAQEELDQTKIDLEDSRERLEGAEDNLRETRDDLSKLESDLREAENSLRDKVDLVDYNERITDITRDMASKVDGEWVDGRLRVEIDGESELIYVKDDIDGMINNTVSKAKYETDQEGIVERFESAESRIYQNEQAIGGMVKQIDYNADQGRLEERLTEWERTADGFNQSVSRLQTDFDNLEIGGRNLFSSNGSYKNESIFKNSPYSVIAVTSWRQYAKRMLVESNAEYVISVWAKVKSGTTTNRLTLHPVQYTTESGSTRSSSPSRGFAVGADWTYIKYPITTHQDSKSMNLYMIVDPRDTGNEIWVSAIKVEKGNKATDWTPAPEDQISYTETRIEQLADKIALEYIKDDDLIAGIRIGDPNPINGANVEITGDTAIYGRLLAPDATFIKISTEEMYAIDAEIKDSKITGKLDANDAEFQKGKFEEAHLVRAKIDEADIIDADITNATITGELNGVGGTFTGQLDGVDGTFTGKMTAGEIEGSELRGTLIKGSEFISETEQGLTRRKTKVDVDGVTV
ncbi:pentapeptide repeat-containing protein, partial [Oceanobacillus indicireducens]|uniref:pentapeptide repeat-containing protein n=1 Tax=Oceanobacillus indicireducens TaxID=1004261 RepID=UPI0016639B42